MTTFILFYLYGLLFTILGGMSTLLALVVQGKLTMQDIEELTKRKPKSSFSWLKILAYPVTIPYGIAKALVVVYQCYK